MPEPIDAMDGDTDETAELADRLQAMVRSHAAQLAEHFDSVQIVCTKAHAEGTLSVPWGEGNWFARYGSVREWVLKREEGMRVEERPPRD